MSLAAIFQAVRARFQTEVATPETLTVVHDNAPEPTAAARWCRFSVSVDSTQQVSTGSAAMRRFRSVGSATAQLFVSQKSGDAALLELADAIDVAFRGARIADPQIRFRAPTLVGTPVQDGAWFARTVRIPFEADTFGSEA